MGDWHWFLHNCIFFRFLPFHSLSFLRRHTRKETCISLTEYASIYLIGRRCPRLSRSRSARKKKRKKMSNWFMEKTDSWKLNAAYKKKNQREENQLSASQFSSGAYGISRPTENNLAVWTLMMVHLRPDLGRLRCPGLVDGWNSILKVKLREEAPPLPHTPNPPTQSADRSGRWERRVTRVNNQLSGNRGVGQTDRRRIFISLTPKGLLVWKGHIKLNS